MITKFSVKGFKTLKDFSVPLTRVSVLVGPNNLPTAQQCDVAEAPGVSASLADFGQQLRAARDAVLLATSN